MGGWGWDPRPLLCPLGYPPCPKPHAAREGERRITKANQQRRDIHHERRRRKVHLFLMHLKTAKKKCLDYDTLFPGRGCVVEGANYFFPPLSPISIPLLCSKCQLAWKGAEDGSNNKFCEKKLNPYFREPRFEKIHLFPTTPFILMEGKNHFQGFRKKAYVNRGWATWKKAKKVSKRVNFRVGDLDMWTLDWAE